MHVLGHDNGCVQMKSAAAAAQTTLQDSITACCRQGSVGSLAKIDENRTVALLEVRKSAAILILGGYEALNFHPYELPRMRMAYQGDVNIEQL